MRPHRAASLPAALSLIAVLLAAPSALAATGKCFGTRATIIGTPGNDVLNGTARDDIIAGLGGNDIINGRGGADDICGGPGNDKLDGAAGGDELVGGSGDDRLAGGAGLDLVSFTASRRGVTASLATGRASGEGSDRITGVEGMGGSDHSDKLSGDGKELNLLFGLEGNDVLRGGPGLDLVAGQLGNDRLEGQGGFDIADFAFAQSAVNVNLNTSSVTGEGADSITGIEVVSGSTFNDTITGDAGDNFLWGADGDDQIFGLSGNDDLQGDGGNDMLDGGEGAFDFADYFFAEGPINASLVAQSADGQGFDEIINIEGLIGSESDDLLTGDEGDNILGGLGGNDALVGGEGFDFAFFIASTAGVTADLVAGTAMGEGSDELHSLEGLVGSEFNDSFTGDDADNALIGLSGNDLLRGLGGDDYFGGMAGDDNIEGGAGAYDLVDFGPSFEAVSANLATGVATGEGSDRLTGVEALIGSIFDDTLIGDGLTNYLFGSDGDDVVSGAGGDDGLTGQGGSDATDGGDGTDSCSADDIKLHCETVGEPPLHPLILYSNAYASAAATIRSKGIRSKG